MKVVHIYGDDGYGYSAQDFNMLGISYEKAYAKAKACDDNVWEFQPGSFVKAIDFAYDHTTPEFIDFVKETIGDSDLLRDEDFFIVDE